MVFDLAAFIKNGGTTASVPKIKAGNIIVIPELPKDPTDNKAQWLRQDPSRSIYIMGAVGAPGRYAFDNQMGFLDLLSAADGPIKTADLRHIRVSARGGKVSDVRTVDFSRYLETGDESLLPRLKTGDVVFVPDTEQEWVERSAEDTVRVIGAVAKPGRYKFSPTGCRYWTFWRKPADRARKHFRTGSSSSTWVKLNRQATSTWSSFPAPAILTPCQSFATATRSMCRIKARNWNQFYRGCPRRLSSCRAGRRDCGTVMEMTKLETLNARWCALRIHAATFAKGSPICRDRGRRNPINAGVLAREIAVITAGFGRKVMLINARETSDLGVQGQDCRRVCQQCRCRH